MNDASLEVRTENLSHQKEGEAKNLGSLAHNPAGFYPFVR